MRRLHLAALATIIACAPAGTQSGSGVSRKGNVISAEEIAALNADVHTAYDAVTRLRPYWLVAHGVVGLVPDNDSTEYAAVYVDGKRQGRLGSLRDIQIYQVAEIRYYDVAQTGARFGVDGGSSGVIEVRIKRPSSQ
ncbi:MAG TPA: hypothetical protein VD771_08975 [Gemmatimonadaceae bacterium]|nr:hypothetical protein [Gemmatimonadaceae bacterium]